MKINYSSICIFEIQFLNVISASILNFFHFELVESEQWTAKTTSQKTQQIIDLSKESFYSIDASTNLIKLNCPTLFYSNKRFVKLMNLNVSFQDFQHMFNFKPEDALYFGNRIVTEGSSLSITCIKHRKVINNRTLTHRIDWYLNRVQINRSINKSSKKFITNQPYRTEQYYCENLGLLIYRLTITKVSFIHSGEYRCSDRDNNLHTDDKSNNHFVEVLINDWESFNIDFLPQIYYDILLIKNQTISKYCPLQLPIQWYKWSTKLNNKPVIQINESGRYTCESERSGRQIEFWIFDEPEIETFTVSGLASVNGELILECKVKESFPLAEINFFVDKSRIDTSREKFSRFELKTQNYLQSTMILSNLTKNDEGQLYTCKARNMIENRWRETEMSESVNITEVKKYRLNLKGYTDVDCPDAVTVDNWYFKDTKINFETNKKYRTKNNGKTLTIVNADVDQEGVYKCELKNKKNRTLIMVTPPRIHLEAVENCQIDLKSAHAYLGKDFQILCKSNNQNIKYLMQWLRDDKVLKSEMTNSLVLEYKNLELSARGNYTCQAENEVGKFQIPVYLRVRDKNAYLWPIGGIIAELAILLTVIWWAERNKSDNEI